MADATIIGGEHYVLGSQLRLTATIRQNGTLVDPTGEITLIVDVNDVAGTPEIYNGGAGNVKKESTGIYYFDLDLTPDGLYEYRWKTASPNGAREGYFVVDASRVTNP
jgi:hypothetical protein